MAPQQELASKERSLFTQIVKNYENKQYKKGLKAAEQILRKKPDHGDTIAMKALIINSQGNTDEAFALAKTALQKSMKSHICWHVYGLLYRANKNFEEAIKAYKFALKLEPDSHQIQKDLALLQIQMRDYQGYIQSRRAILQSKTLWRQNWTALAVAQHLAGNLWDAERTLTTFEETLRSPPPKTDIEHAEAILYKNAIIAEMGDTERALAHLDATAKHNLDKSWVMEKRAEYLLHLDQRSEAEKAYEALIERNSECRIYYHGLIAAKGIDTADKQALRALYQEYSERYPKADGPRRIPLDFLEGEDFKQAAGPYLHQMLFKGVPSAFANIKALYSSPSKRDAVQELVEAFARGEISHPTNGIDGVKGAESSDRFETSIHFFLAQHYSYHLSRNLSKAIKHIDEAINANSESVDYYQVKGRIHKHLGNYKKAAELMEHARTLDTRDRYINTKAAKYQLRNDETEAAIQNMGKFTRSDAVGGALGDLHDMQCQWYIYEDGKSCVRQGKIGLALKRFHSIYNIFDTWQEDQFDFHSFSLRKGQIRAYVDMIRWEDCLRAHPYFVRSAIAAIEIYIRLFDHPELGSQHLANGIYGDGADVSERRKAKRKAKKEQERAIQAESEKKDSKKGANLDQNGEPKKVDKDPLGDLLVQTSDPLGDAMKFVNPLLEFNPCDLQAQQIAFEVFIRRGKHLLALRSLLAAQALSPSDPVTHYQKLYLRHSLKQGSPPTTPKTASILEHELSSLVAQDSDLTDINDAFLQTHPSSAPQVQSALRARVNILDPSTKEKSSQDVIRTLALDQSNLVDARRGLDILREWKADTKFMEDYLTAAQARYPEANAFVKKGDGDAS